MRIPYGVIVWTTCAGAATATCYTLVNLGEACSLVPCATPCVGSVESVVSEPVTTSRSATTGGRSRVDVDFLCAQRFIGLNEDGVCGIVKTCQSTVGGYILSGVFCPEGPPE